MVLCIRCRRPEETRVRVVHCSMMGGRCLACKEDLELEQKIQELQERRRELRTRMNVNHDPFILKLPPEVASHIFLLSMGARDAYKVSGNGLPTPFLLGAVCRGWRQLARSTPRLWSTLDFNLTDSMDALPHLVADWLERSGGLPLTLKVYYSDRGSDLLKKRYIPSTPSTSIRDVGLMSSSCFPRLIFTISVAAPQLKTFAIFQFPIQVSKLGIYPHEV